MMRITLTGLLLAAAAVADDDQPARFIYKTVGERQLVMEVDYPEDWSADDRRPAIVFFRGGGWSRGDTEQFADQAKVFAGAGLVALRAEYRDTTRDKVEVPACVEDAISAMRAVRSRADRLGIDPSRIVASGGSAGGFLAASTWTTRDFHAESDDTSVSHQPDALVLFNPVFDLIAFQERHPERLAGWEDEAKQVSPSWNVREGMPPTLIMIGTKDGFRDQVEAFRDKAAAAGAPLTLTFYEDQPHGFFNRSPWKERTVSDALAFLRGAGILK